MSRRAEHMTGTENRRLQLRLLELLHTEPTCSLLCTETRAGLRCAQTLLPQPRALSPGAGPWTQNTVYEAYELHPLMGPKQGQDTKFHNLNPPADI